MKKAVWTFGLLSGFILVVFVTTVWLLGKDTDPEYFDGGEKIGYTVMVLSMGLIFFAIKQVRDKELAGILSFGKAIQIGTFTNLIASSLFGLFNIIYFRFLAPDFLAAYGKYYREDILNSGLPQAELDKKLAELDTFKELGMNPEFNAFVMFATVFLIGLVVTLISAVVLKQSR